MTKIFNRTQEKDKRRILRKRMTDAEKLVWSELKKRANRTKYRRQYSIGPYIIDFYCPNKKLAIEIDGYSHNNPDSIEYDEYRDKYIGSLGIKTIRFTNTEVYKQLDEVIRRIEEENLPPSPALSPYQVGREMY
jgi:very-short-patch-repair endonuclease